MALTNRKAESWMGEDRPIELDNITDSTNTVLDWSAAVSLRLEITTRPGQGSKLVSLDETNMTRTTTKVTIPIKDSDWGSTTSGNYWWELSGDWGGGWQQIVAPSQYTLHSSLT